MNRPLAIIIAALAPALFSACDRAPAAYGEANSIIVAAPDSVWQEIGDSLSTALQPRVFTTRDEFAFRLTHISPYEPEWQQLRKFRQILVVGRADDPWVEPALTEDALAGRDLPAIIEAGDPWANGQRVTALVLPPAGGAAGDLVLPMVPALADRWDDRFRSYARQRMFASGVNDTLQTALAERAGFSLTLPQVYKSAERDSVYLFQNLNPDPSRLIRSVLVTWRTGSPAPSGTDGILEWRREVSGQYYDFFDQRIEEDRLETAQLDLEGLRAREVQGVWSTPPGEWPAAGAFISRVIECPDQDRTYFVDAWLYAPGRDKYEYMIQLNTILDTFRCGDATPVTATVT